ncbi:MAG: hypothetical protein J6L86_03380 [Alphaproteobacteria bacterium]|nr:hypothetical protein [Alphaproteobacteria bacterium]
MMTKLYHYAPQDNTIMKDGILSVSHVSRELSHYAYRAKSDDKNAILQWLDACFSGRSRSVSCLTEPIRWQGNDPMLKDFVDNKALFSFDIIQLVQDGIVEAIWCKDGSETGGINEKFYQVSAEEIDFSPLQWEKCDKSKGLFFAVIRHYLIVLKDGIIPPHYLTWEK